MLDKVLDKLYEEMRSSGKTAEELNLSRYDKDKDGVIDQSEMHRLLVGFDAVDLVQTCAYTCIETGI